MVNLKKIENELNSMKIREDILDISNRCEGFSDDSKNAIKAALCVIIENLEDVA